MPVLKRVISIILILSFFTFPVMAKECPRLFFGLDSTAGLISFVPKGNTIKQTGDELYFKKLNSNDAFVELNLSESFANEDNFVISFEYEPVNIKAALRLFNAASDNDSYYFFNVHSDGNLYAAGNQVFEIFGKTQMDICVDLKEKCGQLYINGEKTGNTVTYADLNSDFKIKRFRLGVETDGIGTEFYVRNIKIYSSKEPYTGDDFTPVRHNLSIMDIEDGAYNAKNRIGDNMVFSLRSFFVNGEKNKYPALNDAYLEGKTLMFSSDMCKYLGDECEIKDNKIYFKDMTLELGSKICIKDNGQEFILDCEPCIKNNILFLPAENMCELSGFRTYSDKRGFVIAGESEWTYTDSVSSLHNTEPIDTIYRYMHFDRPEGSEIVSKVKDNYSNNNPRILVTNDRINKIKENIKNDRVSENMYMKLINEADSISNTCVEYKLSDDMKLFEACMDVKERLLTLSAAYMLTDVSVKKEEYASKIWAEMENSLNWKDWNTQNHFLDSGKIAVGIAVGYDALRGYLTSEQKQWVQQRVRTLYFEPCIKAYIGRYNGSEFRYSQSNWGAVCSGAILSVCLSFASEAEGEFKEDIEFLIGNSMHSLEYPMGLLYPDGAWHEGPGYWSYIAEYLTSYCVGVLQNTCGDDFGFSLSNGFYNTYDFILGINGPQGAFNYDEYGEQLIPCYVPQGYQAAHISGNADMMSNQYLSRETFSYEGDVLDVLWYEPSLCSTDVISLPKDMYFEGNEIGVMRDSWHTKNTAFVGMRAGTNIYERPHYDKGTFVFDNNGVRWAIDLGRANRTIPGYYGRQGQNLYRNRTEGHNCVVINPSSDTAGQLSSVYAYVEKTASSPKSGYMIYNLTDVYADNVNEYKRGFYLGDNRESLTIRDEISLKKESDIYWFMHTRADIKIDADKKGATLYQDGQKLRITAICDGDWYFEERKPQQMDLSLKHSEEYSVAGIRKLAVFTRASGDVNITVKMTSTENTDATDLNKDLSDWKLEDGECSKNVKILSSSVIQPDINNNLKVIVRFPIHSEKVSLYLNNNLTQEIQTPGNREDIEFLIDTSSIKNLNNTLKAVAYIDGEEYADEKLVLINPINNDELFNCDFSNENKENENTYLQNCGFGLGNFERGHITPQTDNGSLSLVINDDRTEYCGYIENLVDLPVSKSKLMLSFDIISRDGVKMYFSAKSNDGTPSSPSLIYLPEEITGGNVNIVFDGSQYRILVYDSGNNIVQSFFGEYKINGFSRVRLTFFADEGNKRIVVDNFKISKISYNYIFEKIENKDDFIRIHFDADAKKHDIIYGEYKDAELISSEVIDCQSVNFVDINKDKSAKLFIWNLMKPVSKCVSFTADDEQLSKPQMQR